MQRKTYVPPEEGIDLDTFKKALTKRRTATRAAGSPDLAPRNADTAAKEKSAKAPDGPSSSNDAAQAVNAAMPATAAVDSKAARKDQRQREREAAKRSLLVDLEQQRAGKQEEKEREAQLHEQQARELEQLRDKLRVVEEEKHALVSLLKQALHAEGLSKRPSLAAPMPYPQDQQQQLQQSQQHPHPQPFLPGQHIMQAAPWSGGSPAAPPPAGQRGPAVNVALDPAERAKRQRSENGAAGQDDDDMDEGEIREDKPRHWVPHDSGPTSSTGRAHGAQDVPAFESASRQPSLQSQLPLAVRTASTGLAERYERDTRVHAPAASPHIRPPPAPPPGPPPSQSMGSSHPQRYGSGSFDGRSLGGQGPSYGGGLNRPGGRHNPGGWRQGGGYPQHGGDGDHGDASGYGARGGRGYGSGRPWGNY